MIRNLFLFIFSITLLSAAYYWTVTAEGNRLNQASNSLTLLDIKSEDINYIELNKPNLKIILNKKKIKDSFYWFIEEPVSDSADEVQVNEIIKKLTTSKALARLGSSDSLSTIEDLKKYKLDQPVYSVLFKTSSGQSQKLLMSDMKNFEGYSYGKIEGRSHSGSNGSEPLFVISNEWNEVLNQNIVYFREKRLSRNDLNSFDKIQFQTLSDQFSLLKADSIWRSESSEINIDQNQLIQILDLFSSLKIEDYVFEGEPSDALLKELSLDKDYVEIKFLNSKNQQSKWSARFAINEKNNALYAMTLHPTYIVKLNISAWEKIGNLNLDKLRDRKIGISFDQKQVASIFFRKMINSNEISYELEKVGNEWKMIRPIVVESNQIDQQHIIENLNFIEKISIDYFVNEENQKKFAGDQMLILKGTDGQLMLQMNWGPEVQDYYLVRTQKSDLIFGILKSKLDSLQFDLKKITPSEDRSK